MSPRGAFVIFLLALTSSTARATASTDGGDADAGSASDGSGGAMDGANGDDASLDATAGDDATDDASATDATTPSPDGSSPMNEGGSSADASDSADGGLADPNLNGGCALGAVPATGTLAPFIAAVALLAARRRVKRSH